MKELKADILPPSILSFIEEYSSKGFHFTLVGGKVRDYFLNIDSTDYDFELRHMDSMQGDEWIKFISEAFPDAKHLGMGVFRHIVNDHEIEMSCARIEVFSDSLGHKNFTPNFISNLSHEDSFRRRDITINSIGVSIDEELNIVDPYDGLNDLRDGLIRYIDSSFFKDPVRLLRCVRFSTKLEFSIVIDQDFEKFDLSQITPHYFLYEISKSRDYKSFCNTLYKVMTEFSISYPREYDFLACVGEENLLDGELTLEDFFLFDLAVNSISMSKLLSFKQSKASFVQRLKDSFIALTNECGDETSRVYVERFLNAKDYQSRLPHSSVLLEAIENYGNIKSRSDRDALVESMTQALSARIS